MATRNVQKIKVVVVGDGSVGKTCLLVKYTENRFPDEYKATVFNNITKDVTVSGEDGPKTVCLDLWDTAGQEDFARIRSLTYNDANVFFFCYACNNPDSYHNVKKSFIPEVKYHCRAPTRILVGLKCDLLSDNQTNENLNGPGKHEFSRESVEEYANKNGMGFMQVSALEGINVEEVFKLAIMRYLSEQPAEEQPRGLCCAIL